MEVTRDSNREKVVIFRHIEGDSEKRALDRIMMENDFKKGVRDDGLFEVYGRGKGNLVYVALDKKTGEVVGGVECFVDRNSSVADGLKIAVDITRQGEGIGKLMTENMMDILRGLGITWVNATPLTAESYKFLKEMGFKYVKENLVGDRFEDAPMEKSLELKKR